MGHVGQIHAIDVTWPDPEQAAYFGVPIPDKKVVAKICSKATARKETMEFGLKRARAPAPQPIGGQARYLRPLVCRLLDDREGAPGDT